MNSGSLKISISSRVYNLSIYFKCFLLLTYVSYSIKILLERDFMLYVGSLFVSLKGAWRITGSNGSVFLHMFMDCLERKCVLMIGDSEYLLALLSFHGLLSAGTGVVVVD